MHKTKRVFIIIKVFLLSTYHQKINAFVASGTIDLYVSLTSGLPTTHSKKGNLQNNIIYNRHKNKREEKYSVFYEYIQ